MNNLEFLNGKGKNLGSTYTKGVHPIMVLNLLHGGNSTYEPLGLLESILGEFFNSQKIAQDILSIERFNVKGVSKV